MNKRNLLKWALYDFGNSFVFVNFLLYFSTWMIVDGGLSDFWYNAIFAITSILLFFSAPTLASFTDKYGGRKSLLRLSTFGTFLGYGLATLFAFLGTQYILIIAICFLIGQYFYQLSFVFYNSLIEDVADSEHRARAFGIGQFSNSIGIIAGLLVALPFSNSRLQPLLPSLVIFILLSLPMIFYFVEGKLKEKKLDIATLKEGEKEYFGKIKAFFSFSIATPVIISFFLFNDALVTISNNYSIYVERVFGFPDNIKNYLLMAVFLMSALGGIISGKIADKIGSLKVLKFILVGWIILVPLIALSKTLILLLIFSSLTGLLLGSVWTVSKAYLSEVLKKEELGYGFSFYTLAERFATLLGPLTWGGIITFSGSSPASYRVAMLSMTLFILIGLLVLLKWKRELRPA